MAKVWVGYRNIPSKFMFGCCSLFDKLTSTTREDISPSAAELVSFGLDSIPRYIQISLREDVGNQCNSSDCGAM